MILNLSYLYLILMFIWNAIQLTVAPLKGIVLYVNVILVFCFEHPKWYQNPGFNHYEVRQVSCPC